MKNNHLITALAVITALTLPQAGMLHSTKQQLQSTLQGDPGPKICSPADPACPQTP